MKLYEVATSAIPHTHGMRNNMETIEKIRHECSEILDIYRGINPVNIKKTDVWDGRGANLLWRGLKNDHDILTSDIKREGRDSMYLHNRVHKLVNAEIRKRGFETTRDNCAFTSADMDIARSWGSTAYAVFPINGFKYLWCSKLGKAYDYMYDLFTDVQKDAEAGESDEVLQPDIESLLDQAGLSDQHLSTAIKGEHEVLISGSRYYGIASYHLTETPSDRMGQMIWSLLISP